MEKIVYLIEDLDGSMTETESLESAEETFINGLAITEMRTVITYTEHTRILLEVTESKTKF